MAKKKKTALDTVKEQIGKVDHTQIFFTDLNGALMTLQANLDDLESALDEGIGFDSSSVAGLGTVDDSDKLLVPVPESFRVLNLQDEKIGFFIGRIHAKRGQRSDYDARSILEEAIFEAEADYGVRFLTGPEHEFFLLTGDEFADGIHTDSARYFLADPADGGDLVRKRIIEVLAGCGTRYDKAHHEVTASQHEINLEATDPLAAADRTLLFNYVAKKAASEHGLHASFMPKPFEGQNRSAFHIHLSMQDKNGRNLFHNADDEHGLSTKAKQFIGGILKYARQSSLVMASTYNSYKAYVVEREAPVVRGWGINNRSSMVRIPYSSKAANTRIELRNPDPAGNVYLQMACLIRMGLAGLREQLDAGRPDVGSTYKQSRVGEAWDERFLPKSLYEALVEAERSKFLRDALGEYVYGRYISLKKQEWEDHRIRVTPYEHEMYLSR